MNSLFMKHFSLTAIMVVFSFTVLGASFVFLGRNFAIAERKDAIYVNAEAMTRTTAAFTEGDLLDSWSLRLIVNTVARSTGNDILLTTGDGLVVACSEPSAANSSIGKRFSDELLARLSENALRGRATIMDNLSGLDPYYTVIMPVLLTDGTVGAYVFVGSDLTSIIIAWNATSRLFIILSIGVMGLSLCLSYFFSKRQAQPINEMAAAARKFAHGDFSVRVTNYDSGNEVGALTESFNSMAESLERSEQLRSDFIANVSHELKTPMTTISGFADGILDGTIPVEEQRQYLEVISSETKRLSRLVRQMLQMSRIQNVDSSVLLSGSFDLSEIIARTLLSFENRINDLGLDVDAQIPEESIIARGDADSITQVFYNLLDNAVKFSAHGSAICVSLWKQDGKAYVSVKNHGEVISPEELPYIFDRFHKTDKSRSKDRDGVGLGLSIVKTIINDHKGDISVTSADGVTEFIFTVRLK